MIQLFAHRKKWQAFRTVVVCCLIASVALISPANVAADVKQENKKLEKAIERALTFLSKQQQESGAWRINSYGESTAGTSLAVMSFLAAGYVPGEGKYGKQINKGIDWVLDHQHENGMLVHRRSHGPMYSHGISTLMLAEVVGMVDKKRAKACRTALKEAIRLILKAQNIPKSKRNAGGWRYNPTSTDSDLSVTGWQLLALRAAKDVGCDVPKENIDKAVQYVLNCAHSRHGGFGYQPGGGPTATRTGTGLLALEVCGKHKSDAAMVGADYLLDHPLKESDHYYYYGVYYGTVGMFKVGGDHWKKMKAHITKLLLSHQYQNGSWNARKHGEQSAGPIYCTSMSVLALTVEYRYLPIYQR